MKPLLRLFLAIVSGAVARAAWPVVDTGQTACYDNTAAIPAPAADRPFFGQDAQYAGTPAAYHDNGDGTVSDLNTGLMWSQAVDTEKLSLIEAEAAASRLSLAGHTDWRVPTIKELYSLIDFRGYTGLAEPSDTTAPRSAIPFIDTDYFAFRYGGNGERYIDAQWLTSTKYVSTTMGGIPTLFGVNFADGRIKGYGYADSKSRGFGPPPPRPEKKFYVRYVRGATGYGVNNFVDNHDGTVTDRASGLTWQQTDSGRGMDWQHALAYAENLALAGHDDWRLPNAKELQSIVDYTRSPDTTDSPAINPVFATTAITNEAKQKDWPFFWTSTTHLDGPDSRQAAYVCFGRGIGQMHGEVMDVHGAGAQRSDPKTGSAHIGHGPQGDAQRILNFVRCVRGGVAKLTVTPVNTTTDSSRYPLTIRVSGQSYLPEKISLPPGGLRPPTAPDAPDRSGNAASSRAGFIQHLDRDHDGKISRSEFDGPPDGFDHFDRNHDGFISSDEAPTGPPPGR
ncbi:MAG: DUF1566 domain-containing protein [Opitutaceae bacterium]|jgi:hypothetical protein